MAKRFTDTQKWNSPYIRGLQGAYKLLWLYIQDECDHAGVWQVDIDVARIKIGEPAITSSEAVAVFGDKVKVIENGQKWFIPDFIEFQYGELNPDNRAHSSVISILTKHCLYKKNKPLKSSLQGAMDKDKDKALDTDTDNTPILFQNFWELYEKKVGDKSKVEKKWMALTVSERIAAMLFIPKYKVYRPDSQFRKDPVTFINNKTWNDELPATHASDAPVKKLTIADFDNDGPRYRQYLIDNNLLQKIPGA